MAEGSAAPRGRWCCCCCCARLLLLCVVLATAGSLSVEMPGRSQIAYVNGNVTLSCQVPGCPSLDTRIMGVTWYRKDLVSEAEVKVFELYGDQQKAFRRGAMVSAQRLKRGDASLQLPGVGLGDAGEYRCELTVTPQKAKGWVLLEVLAKPDSTMFLEKTKVSGKGRHLVCQSSGFYPEAINITWEKWTQKVPQHQVISKDICTGPTIKNKDGVFSITSYLKLNASLEDNGTIYQCVVEHPSLSISQKVNFTLLVIGSHYVVETDLELTTYPRLFSNLQRSSCLSLLSAGTTEAEKIYHTWILFFSCFGLILMLFLFLYIWRRFRTCWQDPDVAARDKWHPNRDLKVDEDM